MPAIGPNDRIERNPRVEHRELTTGEAVLLHLDTAAYHGINAIGALIWSSIGAGTTLSEVVTTVRAGVDQPPASLEDDVVAFVGSLADRDLLVVTPEVERVRERDA